MPDTATAPPPRWAEYQAVTDLVPAERNAKAHDQGALAASVREFGYVEPVVVDERTGRLLAGHGRTAHLGALEASGAEPPEGVTVGPDGRWQVLVVRGVRSRDDLHADAMAIALNRVGERGGWDTDVLAQVMDDLQPAAELYDAIGWTADQLDDLIASTAPPAPNPWKDRRKIDLPDPGSFDGGQVWQVGPHRLVVGDSRDPAAWAWLPEAHLLITDPPYGIAYTGGGSEREVIDDDDDPAVAAALLDRVLGLATERVSAGAGSYIFLPGGEAFPVLLATVHHHSLHRWSLVWAKDQATFGRADFHQQHEHISYGWFRGPRRVPVENRKLTTLWEFARPRSSEHHPTAKPVALLQRAVEASSHDGDVVLDPFAGSGSTLVAAAKSGRIGVGIEKVPAYAKVAVDRLAEATGATPELVAGMRDLQSV